jgi:hypothetical protein
VEAGYHWCGHGYSRDELDKVIVNVCASVNVYVNLGYTDNIALAKVHDDADVEVEMVQSAVACEFASVVGGISSLLRQTWNHLSCLHGIDRGTQSLRI